MPAFNANVLMKELRKTSGLTQKQVAEGICSRGTLASLEAGHRKPDWFTFKNVLLKLGVDPTLYYNSIISENEAYLLNQEMICIRLGRTSNRTEQKAEIDKMEKDPLFATGQGLQILLAAKGNYYLQISEAKLHNNENGSEVEHYLALAIDDTMMLLEQYRPGFDVDKISDYFLSNAELRALMRLASLYTLRDDIDKAVRLGYLLAENSERNYKLEFIEDMRNIFANIIGNLLYALMDKLHRYEECLVLVEKGLAYLVDISDIFFYYRLSYTKAFVLLHLGRKEEGEELFKKCIMFSYGAQKFLPFDMSVDVQKDEFVNQFGYKPDLTVTIPWDE